MKFKTFLLLSFTLILAACGSVDKDNSKSDEDTLHIYTTVFPLYSITKEIGGDTVEVKSVYPKNVNIHSYEPSQKDILSYAEGDLFIFTNEELDPLAKKINNTIGSHTKSLATFSSEDKMIEENHEHEGEAEKDHIEHEEDDHEAHAHGSHDPHVWLDPNFALEMAESIAKTLSEMQPQYKGLYEENFESLKEDLMQMDAELKTATNNAEGKTVYISHESIGYLAERYHFKQIGISGLNNEEPSQKALTEIVTHIKKEKIPYILYEQNVSSRVTDMIGRETSTEFLPFHNLETMTDKDPKNATYQSMMNKNIESLSKVLK
ncbi:metal ABC transporter solute-binding protein, Zn/Mn family [Phocicoccus pinnipedialis]|uniref:High-affinity zinc uptake system binding-protein ZnuA n=1 Tax=Phocicoccus pinnipedialis TaxID=110845 RepID=A0A6V7R9Y4_9BACL|nr:zinc ABC transporter substrate-binding protein [Jeotgalicoccus pinnipedialis]MBP1940196.1 zinc transport system substrate-binding protein [Jeotgalicoccus pinnipedialis]CAD2073963.1 High-affinity zinc uptake system binding-protein ZnuA precursor [Jeotgalicoccus pinnipedialis]